jgi:hypothetical protein
MAKEFVLKINGEPAAKTIKGIQDQITALDEKIKTSDINDPDFSNLIEESNKAKQALGVLQKEGVDGLKPKGAIEGLKGIGQSLSSIPGPIGGAVSGFQGLSKAAMAFVANPIGAVITALVAIFAAVNKAINSTEKGTFALNKVFGALGGIIKPITKAIGELAALVAEGLVKAMESAIDVISIFAPSFGEAADAGMKLAQTLNEIDEAEGDLEVARAKQNKQLAETRELLSDTNASYEDRKKALDQIKTAETALAQQEVDLAKKRLDAANEKAKQDGESKENLDAIDAATIKLLQTEQDLAAKRRQFNKEEKKLKAEDDAKEKETAAKAKAYADERLAAQDKIRAAEQKNLLASIKDQEERDKKAAELELQNSKREIDRGKYTAAEKKKLKLEADKTYALQLEKINKDAADKELAVQKELADALVNTDQEKFDKQQQDTTDNYNKLIEKAEGNAEMIAKLEAQKLELLKEQEEQFNKDQENKKKASEEKILADAKEVYEKRISEIEKSYDKEAALLEQKGLSDRELRKQQDELELKELEDKLAATEKNTDEYYKLELELYRKKKEIRDKDFEETIANLNAGYDIAASLGQGLMELDAIRTETKLANENLTEQEREKIAKESFEKQKKLQYAMALIDAAKAVTSIIAQYPKFDGGFAMTAALITTGITTAFNIAKISATQYQSKSSTGAKSAEGPKTAPSRYQMGGVLSGPTHDMGGIKTALGELEGGEFVMNRRSTANFLPILEQLNNLGNVPGAQVPAMTQTPIVKTYVVASDMTSQQEADSKLSQLARLD